MKTNNICTKKTWVGNDKKENVSWLNVGVLKTTDEGKQFIELNIFPNTQFFVFEQKKKEEAPF